MYLTQQMQPRAMIESMGTERNYLKKEKHSSFIYWRLSFPVTSHFVLHEESKTQQGGDGLTTSGGEAGERRSSRGEPVT